MTKPSINWDHVAKHIVAMATDEDGDTWLYADEPTAQARWRHGGEYVAAESFASFVPGTCHWCDSLVIRPGYEETGDE